MKKKTILNICMVLTIILIAVCGVMAVGSVKGWFGNKNATDLTISEKSGIVMLERDGIAYELAAGTAIRENDRLYTKASSILTVSNGENAGIYVDENTELVFSRDKQELDIELEQGEILIDTRQWESAATAFSDGTKVQITQASAAVSARAGSTMVYVFSGQVSVFNETNKETTVAKAGNVVTVAKKSESEITVTTSSLTASSLNEFELTTLSSNKMDSTFCFTEADLKKVSEEREAEILKAQQALLLEETAKAEKKTSSADSSESKKTSASEENTVTSADTSEEVLWDEDIWEEEDDVQSSSDTAKYCTIEIRCDTILNNMDNLKEGKEAYVPSNGTILAASQISFSDGETVFDVLKRACDLTSIQLEYSYTPLYESYYIEGINHLYEFDCGEQSGWMYKVNGWFPNYGCSSYTLKDGDVIVWCYTCNGLGADVGGGTY